MDELEHLAAWQRELADVTDSQEYRALGRRNLWYSFLAGLALEPLTGRGYMREAAKAREQLSKMRLEASVRALWP